MIRLFSFLICLISSFAAAQSVALLSVKKMHENKDTFLYRISPETADQAQYLAELEVRGIPSDEAALFRMFYKEAKTTGANSYTLAPNLRDEKADSAVDPMQYRVHLYYTDPTVLNKEYNTAYVLNPLNKEQRFSLDGKVIYLPAKSYVRIPLTEKITTLSTRKFLGASVKLKAQPMQEALYFQLKGFSVTTGNEPGLNFSSSDFIRLETSYAQFLTLTYSQISNSQPHEN